CTPHCHPTRPNVRGGGAPALNLPIPEEREPGTTHPFKGNMDVAALRRVLSEQRERVPLVMITVTNNSGGGQPVSMANLREVSAACREFGVPLIMDCCRYAENARSEERRVGKECRARWGPDCCKDREACRRREQQT